ncbi:citrulline utilization hydrolase CtlX [Aquimarina brevivitae]|uniref:Amidinotransferase n=1 Tax=Aquimarina brevivitae TaxID=323412 RepID=A0A4Q7PHD9_9FLAO|nr:arginine deiminase-related protein [Aquimarina brevivitae]RZS99981.1 hypothetical protein EV197_1212 [Aquimarina brevivitae]
MKQVTNTILMIRPVQFRMNEQTAVNNYYQAASDISSTQANEQAEKEFDAFVDTLKRKGVNVIVENDDPNQDTPDSIFPNNWISFHNNGDIALYPMFAPNRRQERRLEVLKQVEDQGFLIKNIVDYTAAEEDDIFLEGTGSLVLDRVHKKAYCALSPRADEELLIEFCEDFEYTPVIFTAYQTVDGKRLPIYHTNVMMGLGETFALVCLDAIDDKKERKNLVNHIKGDGKELIALSEEQINNFAGNVLQVIGADDIRYLVMSTAAYNALTEEQKKNIQKHCQIVHSDLSTIETLGGGSARCMMAEVFLPKE